MTKYNVSFWGKKAGAIGISYAISDTVDIPDSTPSEEITHVVLMETYKRYEHISGFSYREATQ